ncbi:MAG: cation:proton antiporter, partial [Alphaproteobacteria bacterium]
LLALVGIAFGALVAVLREVEGLWVLGDFVAALDGFGITSEAVFFVFLPTLIFESALSIDVRRLIDDISPILVLAVVGLLVSAFTVAGALYVFADVAFIACLLLGAIVSATDPVAVVAIFKDLGAPKRLAILVEGESLFNDATAIVMFTILLGMLVTGSETDLLGGAGNFIKVFAGGVIVGYLSARGMCFVIGRLHAFPLVDITLTVCLAYLSFLLAEHYLHVSGVMAVVTAALVVGSHGRTSIKPATWHSLIEIWEQLSFWANSLIFVLVGLIVPKLLVDFGPRELGLLAVLMVSAFAARAVIIYGLLPVISAAGLAEKVSGAYATVMFWGGLRGAVSLALALAILENRALTPDVKSFVVVLVTGFVLFTLFVNAPTMRALLAALGLDKLSPADLVIRNRVMALSLAAIRDDIREVANDYRIEEELAQDISGRFDERLSEVETNMEMLEGLSAEDRVRTGLTTLLSRERKLYLRHFAHGFISSPIARILLARTEIVLDAVKTGGVAGHDETIRRLLGFSLRSRLAARLHRRLGFAGPLARGLADRYEVLLVTRMVLRELIGHNRRKITPLFGDQTGAALERLLDQRIGATEQQIEALTLAYPDYARTLQSRLLERVAVRLESADYDAMLENSVISHEVFSDLRQGMSARAAALDRRPPLDLGLDPGTLVAKVPYFADLSADRVAEIAALLKPRLALPGECVVRRGDPGDAMYFISSGAVEADVGSEPVRLGSGDFFGEIALLRDQPRTADVTALGYCQLLALYVRDFRRMLDADADLRARITRVAEARLAKDRLEPTPGQQADD